ncbi:hypothetical protein L2223_18565 [Xanthomonas perforans]|uniref:hypothetical protein n=1 Tax=Xanthomonas perforans TaxID=442694 RepID=UPI001F1C473B|nr:hypothetical protein [Xanthomonas perforans]MCF5934619.1 hypothetical protein [Xanthomonas perforans]
MTAPVDVLVEMEDAARLLWTKGQWPVDPNAKALGFARAAVAELIEAAKEVQADAAILGMEIPRLAAALTRVGGAA